MVASYFSLIGLSFISPRRAARRVLTPEPGAYDGVLLALAASCLVLVGDKAIEYAFDGSWRDVLNTFIAEIERQARADILAGRRSGPIQMVRVPPAPPLWPYALIHIVTEIALVLVGGFVAWRMGLFFTGKGTLAGLRVIFGTWLLAVAAPLAIVFELLIQAATPNMLPPIIMFSALAFMYSAYLLAVFIAEAHRFSFAFLTFLALIPGGFLFYFLMEQLFLVLFG